MAASRPTLFPDLPADPEAVPADGFTTGILPSQRIRWLVSAGHLRADEPILDEQIQPASVDLRLGPVAYRVRASFLPNRATVARRIEEFKAYELDLTRPTVLERGCVYIVPLMEEVNLPSEYWGKANPKSSTGRVDVFTRVITDYATEFERVPPGYKGRLYLEIVPRTFSVVVSQGVRLSQLRFWRGTPVPSDKGLTELHETEPVVYVGDEPSEPLIAKGLWVTVDLAARDGELVGYRAKRHTPPLDLSLIRHYETLEYWDPVYLREPRHLVLDPDEFYILASKQRVAIPPSFAADMVGYDPSVGEFRVHYAGFFDPGFGFGPDGTVRGAHAVLEVRSHEVPFLMEDDQKVARLVFERLQAPPDKIYGGDIGSSYQGQALALSKHFK